MCGDLHRLSRSVLLLYWEIMVKGTEMVWFGSVWKALGGVGIA